MNQNAPDLKCSELDQDRRKKIIFKYLIFTILIFAYMV